MRGPANYAFIYHVMAAIRGNQQPTINILILVNRAQLDIHEYAKQWILSLCTNKLGTVLVIVRMDTYSGTYA